VIKLYIKIIHKYIEIGFVMDIMLLQIKK